MAAINSGQDFVIAYLKLSSLKVATGHSGNWTVEMVDECATPNQGQYRREPSISSHSDSSIGITYFVDTNPEIGEIRFAHKTGMEWQVETIDEAHSSQAGPTLAYDTLGSPLIVYYDEYLNNSFSAAWWDGQSWDLTTIGHYGEQTNPGSSIAFGPDGQPAVSHFDSWIHGLRVTQHTDIGWSSTVVDTSGVVGHCSSIAIDQDGNPAVSYYDSSQRVLKFAWYH
jgi:hypothetical protein